MLGLYARGAQAEPAYAPRMALEFEELVVDSRNPAELGKWWAEALEWESHEDSDGDVVVSAPGGRLPSLLFIRVPEEKTVKNRLHLDFRPDDRDAEVERLLGMGATRADVGQGEEAWVVLADPEGNEFCILSSRRAG